MKLVTAILVTYILGTVTVLAQALGDRETGDYNFDGYPDYRQQSDNPGNQCGWWDYYLFDPEIDDYRAIETALCKEQFDSERKVVVSQVSGGMAGLIYVIRHFRWNGFELVATFAEAQTYDKNRELFVRTRVTNIDLKSGPTVYSEILTPDEVGADPEAQN